MNSVMRVAIIYLLVVGAARAQDMPGVELCTHEARMERRTGCLQSNIEYLQGAIAKNAAAAQQRENAAAGEIAALRAEIAALRAALAGLRARLDKLETAAKPPPSPAEKPAVKH